MATSVAIAGGLTPRRVGAFAAREMPMMRMLRYRPPLAVEPLLRFLRDRAVPGVEEVTATTYRRSLGTPAGPAVLALEPIPGTERVRLDVTAEDARAVPAAVAAARRILDLDADPVAVAETLGRDPLLRPLIRRLPGIRLPGAAAGFEVVVRAILGQQVSVPAARTMLGRVAGAYGDRSPSADPGIAVLFPEPETLAEAPLERLGITGGRALAIRRVATMTAGGELDLTGRGDPHDAIGRLLDVTGIGPWTAQYVRMRALHDPDAFPAGDLGVRRAFERLGLDPSPRTISIRAERWRPWRAYATMLLWEVEGEEATQAVRRR
jgi:AraC family transcriptional regulator of adaptative response / DNA-3-methyladenine glycosylase II